MSEEVDAISEALTKMSVHNLSAADRFLYEMSLIPRYEKRLQALLVIKSFEERCADLVPQVEG